MKEKSKMKKRKERRKKKKGKTTKAEETTEEQASQYRSIKYDVVHFFAYSGIFPISVLWRIFRFG